MGRSKFTRRHTWLRRTSASARTVFSSKFLSTPFCSLSTRASSSSNADCCEASLSSLALDLTSPFFSGDSGVHPFTVVSSREVFDSSVVAEPVELVAEQVICIELSSESGFCMTFSDCVALAVQSPKIISRNPNRWVTNMKSTKAHRDAGRPAPDSSSQCHKLALHSKRQKYLRHLQRRERRRVLKCTLYNNVLINEKGHWFLWSICDILKILIYFSSKIFKQIYYYCVIFIKTYTL